VFKWSDTTVIFQTAIFLILVARNNKRSFENQEIRVTANFYQKLLSAVVSTKQSYLCTWGAKPRAPLGLPAC